jgi:hypothetical protein
VNWSCELIGASDAAFACSPNTTISGTAFQATVAPIKLSLQMTEETMPVWSADWLSSPSVLDIRGDATAEADRNGLFETAQWQINAASTPYYGPA